MPKISIIVPIYNVEKYLARCIDSILNQTFKDFECILVDDGSPDKCGEICDEYAKKDKRIRVIHKPNGGLSDARNTGLDIAQGEYIGFIDSDDWIHPQMYEILYSAIRKTNAGIVTCMTEKESEFLKIEDLDVEDELNRVEVYSKDEILSEFYNKFERIVGVSVCVKLYKKSIFDNLRFKKGIIYEDDRLMIPTILTAGVVAVIRKRMYFCNNLSVSIQRSPFTEARLVALDNAAFKNSFFEKNSKQYNIGLVRYCEKYVAFSMVVNLCKKRYRKKLKKSFKKYKKEIKKNIFKILRNKALCKMLKLAIINTFICNKLNLNISKKVFPHLYDIATFDLSTLC